MKETRHFQKLVACTVVVVLGGTAPAIVAAQTANLPQGDAGGWAYGMGPGMMGSYGADGMGPGMMGGYGGGGMGPGMMGGYGGGGMGPGMMGGYGGSGMGPGMTGPFGWGGVLDLTAAQQASINKIRDETRKAHWALMGSMLDQQARLRDLYTAPKQDTAAINETYKAIGKLQHQMYRSSVDAHARIEAVLTKEQKEKLDEYWRKGEAAVW